MIRICRDIATRKIVATSGLVACRAERTMLKCHAHKSGVVVPFRAPAATPSTPLLNRFTAHVSRAKTADAILDGLDEFASRLLPANVLGVGRMPQRTSDWRSIKLGKTSFCTDPLPLTGGTSTPPRQRKDTTLGS
jgi:hypothetical protein